MLRFAAGSPRRLERLFRRTFFSEGLTNQWPTTQNNLGNALNSLGQRESGTARLLEAVTAFEAALEEKTQDRVPLDWAMTQNNLAAVEIALFDKDGQHGHLVRAVDHAGEARAVFLDSGASQYVAIIDNLITHIETRRRL